MEAHFAPTAPLNISFLCNICPIWDQLGAIGGRRKSAAELFWWFKKKKKIASFFGHRENRWIPRAAEFLLQCKQLETFIIYGVWHQLETAFFFLRVEVTAPSTGQNETSQHCVTKSGLKLTRGLFYLYKRLVDLLYRTMKNSFYSDRFLIFELWSKKVTIWMFHPYLSIAVWAWKVGLLKNVNMKVKTIMNNWPRPNLLVYIQTGQCSSCHWPWTVWLIHMPSFHYSSYLNDSCCEGLQFSALSRFILYSAQLKDPDNLD